MSYYMFDSIRHAMIVAVIVETIMVLMWAFSQWRWRRWALLAGPLLAGLIILLDYSVETNREQLERLTEVYKIEDGKLTKTTQRVRTEPPSMFSGGGGLTKRPAQQQKIQ